MPARDAPFKSLLTSGLSGAQLREYFLDRAMDGARQRFGVVTTKQTLEVLGLRSAGMSAPEMRKLYRMAKKNGMPEYNYHAMHAVPLAPIRSAW